jgi:hypothetical protein
MIAGCGWIRVVSPSSHDRPHGAAQVIAYSLGVGSGRAMGRAEPPTPHRPGAGPGRAWRDRQVDSDQWPRRDAEAHGREYLQNLRAGPARWRSGLALPLSVIRHPPPVARAWGPLVPAAASAARSGEGMAQFAAERAVCPPPAFFAATSPLLSPTGAANGPAGLLLRSLEVRCSFHRWPTATNARLESRPRRRSFAEDSDAGPAGTALLRQTGRNIRRSN